MAQTAKGLRNLRKGVGRFIGRHPKATALLALSGLGVMGASSVRFWHDGWHKSSRHDVLGRLRTARPLAAIERRAARAHRRPGTSSGAGLLGAGMLLGASLTALAPKRSSGEKRASQPRAPVSAVEQPQPPHPDVSSQVDSTG